jgi:hypothetical protein
MVRHDKEPGMDKVITRKVVSNEEDVNRDPLSGETGAHPVGTGAGALAAGVAGAALGIAGGPAGMLVGAAVGAIAGGALGHHAAESLNPTAEEIYWREYFVREPYYAKDKSYEYYAPAYQTGWEGRKAHTGRRFDDIELELKQIYERRKTAASADWADARVAARAAWERVDHNWQRPKV